MWIFETLIFIATIVVASYLWKIMRFIVRGNKIPTSSFDASFKNLFEIVNGDTKRFYYEVAKGYDVRGLSKAWFGPLFMVNITTPEDVKIVMNSKYCVDKPYFIKEAFRLTQGTIFGHIEPWKRHRKILNPYFGVIALRSIVPIFNAKVKILMENLKSVDGKEEFNVFHYFAALTLETILSVMEYDVDIQNLEKEKRDIFIENLETFMETSNYRMIKLWLHPDFIFTRSTLGKRQLKAVNNSGMAFTPDIIKRARERVVANSNNNDGDEIERSKTFIRELVNPKHQLSGVDLSDEIHTLILAAQDTSGIASSTTLLLLAMHKDKQDKVVEELRRVVGAPSEDLYLDMEKINELEYLEMTINEAMRLIPVVPLVFRSNEQDIISSEGYTIPAGSHMIVPIFHIHTNKEFWGDDAHEFKPERFSKENISKIHPYAFLPFAKGPRMCIGWRYAMFLMKIQLTNILLKYEIDTSLKLDELEFRIAITLNVCQGFKISIKERKNS